MIRGRPVGRLRGLGPAAEAPYVSHLVRPRRVTPVLLTRSALHVTILYMNFAVQKICP